MKKPANIEHLKISISCIFIAVLFLISTIVKIPKENENFLNSDATYHTLLTIKSLNDNPVKIHHFLPIITLSNNEDKHITWGATIPDKYGNYYYTSFMPLSFIVPYTWFKVTGLEINEINLYIFNCILGSLSLITTNLLFIKIFRKKIQKNILILIVSLFYMFSPELIHTHGLVYWGQSLFQLIITLQLISFISLTKNISKFNFFIFALLCILSPMTEWTGYISNLGFMVLILINHFKKEKIFILNTLKTILLLITSNLLAIFIFISHFLPVVNQNDFINAIKNRFLARNITSPVSLKYLLSGYYYSFRHFLIVFILSMIFLLVTKRVKNYFRIKEFIPAIILLTFPLAENIIMKEHAITYSYDRSKAIFIIILLPLMCLYHIKKINKKIFKIVSTIFITTTFLISIYYLYNYTYKNNLYRWKDNELTGNKIMSQYINTQFTPQNSILAQDFVVRGYDNLLFNRSIIEFVTIENALSIARSKNTKYLIYFIPIRRPWQKEIYKTAIIYDLISGNKKEISIKENKLYESDWLQI